jgi:hypothetical protein
MGSGDEENAEEKEFWMSQETNWKIARGKKTQNSIFHSKQRVCGREDAWVTKPNPESRCSPQQMFRRGLSRVSLTARASGVTRGGGHGHGARMLPFARMAPPTEKVIFFSIPHPFIRPSLLLQIPDETYYVWDDGVAPESAIDIEVQHVPLSQVITSQLTAVLILLGIWGIVCLIDPADKAPAAPRRLALPSRAEMDFDDDHGRG